MSSVLPIDNQRYESGDYTLEVTAHASPLSAWSDRPVVRQLRFNLWSGSRQQQLAAGNQHQLMAISDTVETYVQTHLTQQAWPQTHSLKLLNKTLEFTTLQLFDLAEVLSACGQRQITLPKPLKRRRPRWVTGSAAASLLIAVGVTTAYLYNRPPAVQNAAISEIPEATFDSASEPILRPETQVEPTAPADLAQLDEATESIEAAGSRQNEESTRPAAPEQLKIAREETASRAVPSAAAPPTAVITEAPAVNSPPEADAEIADVPAPTVPAGLDEEFTAAAAPEVTPQPTAEQESAIAGGRLAESSIDSASDSSDSTELGRLRQSASRANNDREILAAIATHFAPYQPTDADYPLTYHVQIAPDGMITAIEPISENAPAIVVTDQEITPAPGRSLSVEITYTGAELPVVRELPQ